jgi:hypothetical protein
MIGKAPPLQIVSAAGSPPIDYNNRIPQDVALALFMSHRRNTGAVPA